MKALLALPSCLLVFLALFATTDSLAQTAWPNRAFRLFVGNSAGSSPDIVARVFANHMSRNIGQPWVVENRPGADGIISSEAVARSAPDGYTMLLASHFEMAINMHLKKSLPVDSARDFMPIAVVVDETTGMAIAVHSSLPVKTLPELIAYAKAHPGKLSYSTTVNYGSMFGAWFKKVTGVDMVEVRYKVASQATQDAVAGRVQVAFQSPGALGPQVKSGSLRFLSMGTAKRIADWPDVPTVAETFPDFSMRGFFVLAGPAGISREVVLRLNKEAMAITKDPKFTQELAKIYWYNYEGARTPEGTIEFIRKERDTWGAFVKSIGLQPE